VILLYNIQEGSFLVKLAREAVAKYILNDITISPPEPITARLAEKSGVFVTLEKIVGQAKSLRGCIGYPLPAMPLLNATIDSAISAAINDPRFPPLAASELGDVVFEVSILTPPVLLHAKDPKEYPKLIKVGRDGLVIEKGYYKGLLLPQVPVELGWDEETFLSECCMKAGLPLDSWLTKNTKVYAFTAEVFMEEMPNGAVVPKNLS
jgi:uncharacterized protein (TIGR00296 family)